MQWLITAKYALFILGRRKISHAPFVFFRSVFGNCKNSNSFYLRKKADLSA
ncbi:hypothetical protein H1P_4470005 [Hyella patelloides LEGE 07179]|uniref:Uncharacterized protein n=1 Tax=Hyella patelloides LEGE 07179 TaxID=945734 RepID=A0A563VY84_9CYAN|nr:hypothetical protein H1P_4470005 [Hyella patelloides LEGE 07179]